MAVDSLDSAAAAWEAGADRIELCQVLEVGGLTPSAGMMEAVVSAARGPVFAMLRPKPGDFVLGPGELDVMLWDIEEAGSAGCRGVVIGALGGDGSIDVFATRQMVAAAGKMAVTFHRALDLCRDPVAGLLALQGIPVTRLLSAGGLTTAFEGRHQLAAIVRAAGAIVVVAGGGVVADHVVELVETTGVREIHLAGVRRTPSEAGTAFGMNVTPSPARVRSVIEALERAFGPRR